MQEKIAKAQLISTFSQPRKAAKQHKDAKGTKKGPDLKLFNLNFPALVYFLCGFSLKNRTLCAQ